MYEFLEYQVADAMTYRPLTIDRLTPLAQVEQLFEEHDFDCLPVCEDGVLLGIVTKLDFLKAFAFTDRLMAPRYADVMQQPAESVMTRRPITVAPDTNLTRVLQLMVETRHKSFPVVIGALLIGTIAREDLLRALRHAAAGEPPPSRERGRERQPWTISPSSVR